MPNDAVDDAGSRFGRDMRRIREARDVSVDTIHASTRIAHTLIETFEETGLVDHPAFNRVYLRSFVRSYADAVDIPEEVALEALDRALDGAYSDELKPYVEGTDVDSDLLRPDADEDAAAGSDAESELDDGSDTTESSTDSASDDSASDDAPATDRSSPDRPSSAAASTSGRADDASDEATPDAVASSASREHPRMLNEGPAESSPAGVDRSTRDTTHAEPSSGRRPSGTDMPDVGALWSRLQRPMLIGLAILIVLLVLGTGLYAVLWGEGDSTPVTADTSQAETPPDSLAAAQPSPARPPANVTLGDTLYLTVLAESDVRGIRIKRDDDLRRPYWIDSSQATVFPFRQEARIEDELDNVRLFLQGYPYPERFPDAQGRILISRDTAEAFVDTLRGAPVQLPTPPDTNRIPSFAQ
jgi:hypothetical protein